MTTKRNLAIVATLFVLWTSVASAASILSPESVIFNNMGFVINMPTDPDSPPEVTIDQSGLSAGFVSGVTNFDAYLAGNPTHDVSFPGLEWFSDPEGQTGGSLGFDLGRTYLIDRIAIWNEEFSGVGRYDIFVADNPAFVGAVNVGGFSPTNWPQSPAIDAYPADVFALTVAMGRYVRLDMSQCPQADALYGGCSLGEVALSVSPAIPEPATLLLVGLGGAGFVARHRRRPRR